jgi:hypothetical protein
MVIYEVNLSPDTAILNDFRVWLKQHIQDMMNTSHFIDAKVYELENEGENPEVQLTCHYIVESRETLESYFNKHAEAMRADGIEKFGSQFTATRRILLPTE